MPTLADIASLLGCQAPPGAESLEITGVATLGEAGREELSLVASDAFVPAMLISSAAACIVGQKVKLPPAAPASTPPALRVVDVDLALAKVLPLFAPPVPRPALGRDITARIDSTALLSPGCAVGAGVYIGQRARIGARCVLHPGVYIGDDVVLGDDCELFPGVVVRERITVGSRVIIHAGSVLGTDGFGYRWDGQQHVKIPQIGTVIIEDDVEIGSCVCVDRAKFSATRIGKGTKIDNLVQIGHNVQIGPHCIVVGQVGLAGSCRLGTGVVLGGQAAVRDHITMGDGSMGAACSGIAEDVAPKAIVSGTPALPHRQSLREQAALRRLPDLVVLVRKLQEQVAELQNRQQ